MQRSFSVQNTPMKLPRCDDKFPKRLQLEKIQSEYFFSKNSGYLKRGSGSRRNGILTKNFLAIYTDCYRQLKKIPSLSAIQNPNDSASKDTSHAIKNNNKQSNTKINPKTHILRKTSCVATVGVAHALIPTVNAEDSIKLTERISNSGKNGYKKLTQSFRRKSLSGNSSMSNSSGISVSGSVSTNSGGLKPNRISGASINSHSSRGSSDKSDFAMGPSCENLSTCPALLNPIMPALGTAAIPQTKHKTKLASSKSVSQDHPRKLPSISSMLAIQNIHPERLVKPNNHNCHQPRISLDSRFKNTSRQSTSYGFNEELSPASARKTLFRERSVSLSNKKMAEKLASLAKLGEDNDGYSNHRDISSNNSNNTTTQLSLEQVIEQKPHRNKFYNFLCSEHSEESLEFILSVRKLNKSQENHSKRSNQAKMIYETHIRQGSEKEINILYKTRKNIEDAMVKTDGLIDFQDILIALDKAKDEIYALLRRDSWPRFLAACS